MLGTSPEEMLKRVQDRNTAGLNGYESRKLARLVTMGGIRSSKRAMYDRLIDQLWKDAEARLKEEVKIARKKK